MYATKEIDHQKRKNEEGSYSLYNHIYSYLMSNFEPQQDLSDMYTNIYNEAKAYDIKGGKHTPDKVIDKDIQDAVSAFKQNNGKRGDTAHNLGKRQSADDSFNNIKAAVSDLKW